MSVKNIAEVLDKSESRIREYLKNVQYKLFNKTDW